MKRLILGLSLTIVALSHETSAMNYSNAINKSSWEASSSVFECRIEHKVPYYGHAVFSKRAGEASRFFLNAQSSRFQAGEVQLVSRAPIWKPEMESMPLGTVPIKRGLRPLWLNSKNTEKMLSELNNGREIEFQNNAWYASGDSPDMRLAISNIGFREVYRRYLDCLAGLLPANFDQLRRSALYFAPGDPDGLSGNVMRTLDKVLMLARADSKVRRFYIDGHSSAPGDRAENLELSKRRAELVAEYLKNNGVSEEWITVRWHGERYPVATNATRAGRAKNRRVTLRLEKLEDKPLPIAAN